MTTHGITFELIYALTIAVITGLPVLLLRLFFRRGDYSRVSRSVFAAKVPLTSRVHLFLSLSVLTTLVTAYFFVFIPCLQMISIVITRIYFGSEFLEWFSIASLFTSIFFGIFFLVLQLIMVTQNAIFIFEFGKAVKVPSDWWHMIYVADGHLVFTIVTVSRPRLVMRDLGSVTVAFLRTVQRGRAA